MRLEEFERQLRGALVANPRITARVLARVAVQLFREGPEAARIRQMGYVNRRREKLVQQRRCEICGDSLSVEEQNRSCAPCRDGRAIKQRRRREVRMAAKRRAAREEGRAARAKSLSGT